MRAPHSFGPAAFLALVALASLSFALSTPILSWRSPTSLSRTLPSLTSVLFDSTPCARRDLAFPESGLGGILVVSVPKLSDDEVVSVEDLRSAEALATKEEEIVVTALAERIHCGVEVRVVEIEHLSDVLGESPVLSLVRK